MNINSKAIAHIKKLDKITDTIVFVLAIMTFILLITAGLLSGSNTKGALVALSLGIISFAAVIIVSCSVPRLFLKKLGFKYCQEVYVVSHSKLRVHREYIMNVNPADTAHLIVTTNPHTFCKNIFLTKKEAEEALDEYTSFLYSAVEHYLKIDVSLSETHKNEIVECFRKYDSPVSIYDGEPRFDIGDFVVFMSKERVNNKQSVYEKEMLLSIIKKDFSE